MGNDNRASQICAARPHVVKAVAMKVAVFPQIRMLAPCDVTKPGRQEQVETRSSCHLSVVASCLKKRIHCNLGGRIQKTTVHVQMHTHDTHPAIIKRLRRAGGHLASVVQMLEQGKPCLDVAQQLQAVEKAITQAKKTLIQDHLDHCLHDMVQPAGEKQAASLEEFRQITKYL